MSSAREASAVSWERCVAELLLVFTRSVARSRVRSSRCKMRSWSVGSKPCRDPGHELGNNPAREKCSVKCASRSIDSGARQHTENAVRGGCCAEIQFQRSIHGHGVIRGNAWMRLATLPHGVLRSASSKPRWSVGRVALSDRRYVSTLASRTLGSLAG